MGAKTAILAFVDRDPREALLPGTRADVDAGRALADELFPGRVGEPLGMWELAEASYPPDGAVYVGRFAGLDIVCCRELMSLAPGALEELVLRHSEGRRAYLHLMHSVSDALTFAYWSDGHLVRQLSVAPDTGIAADQGPRFEFELPYWAGEHPVGYDRSWFDDDDEIPAYPLPFHPLELGEQALDHFFGFVLEGWRDPAGTDPMQVHLAGYRLAPTWAGLDRAAAIAEAAQHMTRRTFILPMAAPQRPDEPAPSGEASQQVDDSGEVR
jgi:hypothetical protein